MYTINKLHCLEKLTCHSGKNVVGYRRIQAILKEFQDTMTKLTSSQQEYFNKEEVWQTGPTYDITLVLQRDFSPVDVKAELLKRDNVELFDDSQQNEHMAIRTILHFDDPKFHPIGLFHSYIAAGTEPWIVHSTYQLSIYPPQLHHFLGSDDFLNWRSLNKELLSTLHLSLLKVIRELALKIPIECATIVDETYSWAMPEKVGSSICMVTEVSKILELQSEQAPFPYDEYLVTLPLTLQN